MSAPHAVEAANGRIASENYIMGTVLLLFAAGLAWMPDHHLSFLRGQFSGVLLPAGGVAFFAIVCFGNAVWNTLRVRKSGKSVLETEEVLYGRGLHGVIRTERVLDPTGDYKLQLKCIERV